MSKTPIYPSADHGDAAANSADTIYTVLPSTPHIAEAMYDIPTSSPLLAETRLSLLVQQLSSQLNIFVPRVYHVGCKIQDYHRKVFFFDKI